MNFFTFNRRFASVIFVFLSFFLLFGCKKKSSMSESKTVNCNLGCEPSGLDPQVSDDFCSNTVIMNVFEGLARVDKNQKAVPGAAEAWESDDQNKTFTFHLKKDAKWSDGETPLTAEDFLYGFQRAIMPETISPTAKLLYCIKNAADINLGKMSIDKLGVYVIDTYTLKIELEYSCHEFAAITAISPAMPCNKKFFQSTSGQYGKEQNLLLTNGPFKMKKRGWEHGSMIRIVKNEHYAGAQKAKIDEVDFVIDEPENCNMNLLQGKFDASFVEPESIETLKKNKIELDSFKDTMWGIAFNCKNEAFKYENIRKGFLAAIDREYILSKLPSGVFSTANDIIMNNLLVAGMNYRDVAKKDLYFKSTEEPKKLLEMGMKEANLKNLPKIEIICPETQVLRTIANNLLENWNKKFSSYFNIKPMSQTELELRVQSGDYQVALIPVKASSNRALDFLNLFRSGHTNNPLQMSVADYDIILQNTDERNPSSQAASLEKAEKYLNDHAYFYPVCSQERYFATKAIKEVVLHPFKGGIDFTWAEK